jgi:tol-pal system protein YbgF
MRKRALGILLIVLWPMVSSGQDKSKKTYELIYQDVQQLKQEFLKLEKRLDAAAEDLRLIKDQLKDLAGQLKFVQSQQARSQDSLNNIPVQYQALLEKFQQIDGQMLKIVEELMALKNQPPVPAQQEQEPQKKDEKAPVAKKTKKEEPVKDKKTAPPVPPRTNLSAQELYNTAYSDYEKGNYDLAIDGLTIYREQFPSSPYADDALYWIGECYFSQKKYDKAIEQFNDLIIGYPLSNKIATAYLKKGFSLAELKKKDEAVAVLKLLITKYPLEEEAKNAQEKLKELQGIK